MATLHVLQGPDKGRTYDTSGEPGVIGRSSDEIHLSDDGASRHHAEIRPDGDGWLLADLNSSNGTYLNGQRVVAPMSLHDGDQIKVGNTLLVFSGKQSENTVLPRSTTGQDEHLSGSAILASLNSSEESVILPAPETADAVAAWNVVYQVAELIGTVDSIDVLLDRLADIVVNQIIVDQLVLLMGDEKTGELTTRLMRNGRNVAANRVPTTPSQSIIDHVGENNEGVLCANAHNDQRFHVQNGSGNDPGSSVHSVICVPFVGRTNIHGAMYIASLSHHTYTHEQLRLAVAIGRLVGMSIENTQLQEERMKTERLAAAGETVAYLSHHIRNILQGMQSGVDVVEMSLKKLPQETVVAGWSLVRKNLDRIYNLTLNMLTFSKDRQPNIEHAQLNDVVTDTISLIQSRVAEKSITLRTDLHDLPPIPLDREGIHQVIQNVMRNAIDAVEESNGLITVTTRYDGEASAVVLTITDNGPGIPDDELKRVFTAFHSTKGHAGTGLGLAAAKKIVDELDGSLVVTSRLEEGTTFRLTLAIDRVELETDDSIPASQGSG